MLFLGSSLLYIFCPSWLSVCICLVLHTTSSGYFIQGSSVIQNARHVIIQRKCIFRLNSLRRLLHGCQRMSSFEYSSSTKNVSLPSRDLPRIRLDLYFDKKSKDFGLLMDLLAEASGLVQSLRYSFFEHIFQTRQYVCCVQDPIDVRQTISKVVECSKCENSC